MQRQRLIRLDEKAIRRRIRKLFRGTASAVADVRPGVDAPHRSTILRWLKGETLPRTADQALALASALDLDPFGLWQSTLSTFPVLCAGVIAASRESRWSEFPPLSFLRPFVGPTAVWPPPEIATQYFGRDWTTADFCHDATTKRNYYAVLAIEPTEEVDDAADQIWHFAWRDRVEDALWRPYGFVRLSGRNLRLYSFAGVVKAATRRKVQPVFVETWFGEGPAEFRVASLHAFKLEILNISPDGQPNVRFGFA